jgi:hypothetical protein
LTKKYFLVLMQGFTHPNAQISQLHWWLQVSVYATKTNQNSISEGYMDFSFSMLSRDCNEWMNEMDESHFYPDSVGKFNLPIQNLKRTKSRGSAVKGKLFLFYIWIHTTYEFIFIQIHILRKLCNHSCPWLTILSTFG